MPRASTTFLRTALAVIVLATSSVSLRVAHAEIHRCQGPDGGMIYTDRPCAEIGATPAKAGASRAIHPGRVPPRAGCARNVAELVLRISNAISQQDTNQLAAVYHWAGMSGGQSVPILRKLDTVAHLPLAGISQVMPYAQPMSEAAADAEYYAKRPVSNTPVALRIEQSSTDGITPSHTVFGLHQHFGCFWIRG